MNGFTPLQLAIVLGNIDMIKASIETKASLEAACGFESTPLQQAVSNGILQTATPDGNLDAIKVLIKVLVEAGASLEAVGEIDGVARGNTPLKLAVYLGNVDTVEALLEAGASLEAVNEHDLTPREYAAKLLAEDEGDADVLKALVDAEAAREEARDTALRAIRDALE